MKIFQFSIGFDFVNMRNFLAVVFVVLSSCSGGLADKNILFISPLPSPSHHIFNRVLALGLVEKGYNVTFLSADLAKTQTKNLYYIHLEKVYEELEKDFSGEKILDYADTPPIIGLLMFALNCQVFYEGIVKSRGLETILNYPDDFKFDAVLYDATWGPTLLPLMAKFNNPPLISLTAFVNSVYTTETLGSHKYPAYIPHYNLEYSTEMNFFQRMWNTLHYVIDSS